MTILNSISDLTKKIHFSLLLGCLFLLPLVSNAQKDLKLQVTDQQIEKVFEDWDNPQKPGIALGIISNGKVVYKKGFGSANLEHSIPVTTSTKFYAGSWNRMITAFAILLLEDEGKLSLHDDVRKYIPEVPKMNETITLHHLLSHTSGLDDYDVLKPLSGWNESDVFTKKHAYDFLKKQKKLNHTPGAEHHLNKTGVMLLEDVVTKVSGKPFASFCKENIFEPLNMKNTFFATSAGEIITHRATGYTPQGNGFRNMDTPFSDAGPAHLYTTVDDILHWMMNLRNPKVGSEAVLKKLETPATLNGKFVEQENQALYLGQHRYWDFKGVKKLYAIGDDGGYSCKIVRFPNQDFMAVVMGNGGDYNGYMTSLVADLYLDKYYNKIEAAATEKVTYKKLSAEKLQNLTGTFWNSEQYFRTILEVKDGQMQYHVMEYNWGSPMGTLNDNTFELLEGGGGTVEVKKINGKKSLVLTFPDGRVFTSQAFDPNVEWAKNLTAFTGTYFSKKLDATYSLQIQDGSLVMTHPRLNNIILEPLDNNTFTSDNWNYKGIIFEPNGQNGMKGFRLNSRRVSDIWFEKISEKIEN